MTVSLAPIATTSFFVWRRLQQAQPGCWKNKKDTVESGIKLQIKNSSEKNCLSVGQNNRFSVSGDELFHLTKKFGADNELIIIF